MEVLTWYGLYNSRNAMPDLGHNATMSLPLSAAIRDFGAWRKYWGAGDWVLDPMAGLANGLVPWLEVGYNFVAIEVEKDYADLATERLTDLCRADTMFQRGTWEVLHGDCRAVLPTLDRKFKVAFTSPPYGNTLSPGDEGPRATMISPDQRESRRRERRDASFGAYGVSEGQLSNIKGDDFWHQQSLVYAGVRDVLLPGGWLVTVTKDYQENFMRVPVQDLIVDAARAAGFEPVVLVRAEGAQGGGWKRRLNRKHRLAGRENLVITSEEIYFFQAGVTNYGNQD